MIHDLYAVLWGATWGNNVAWLESLAVTGIAVYLGRDKIGRHVAAWLHKHHEQHLAELERHRAAR